MFLRSVPCSGSINSWLEFDWRLRHNLWRKKLSFQRRQTTPSLHTVASISTHILNRVCRSYQSFVAYGKASSLPSNVFHFTHQDLEKDSVQFLTKLAMHQTAANLYSYVEKPKYRCPRCKTGTCSLPCYKRHQQRASCNGQRDPAEYLKKSQLATPEGIDRDFNYLKGVERDMDNAHRDTRDRGIGSSNRTTKTAYRGGLPESKFQRYLGNNRITVARAPKGMSRQKSNQTRSTKYDAL